MDLHALSQDRTMLLLRGGIAFMVGVIASNQPGISADGLLAVWGVWAVVDGAATLRQASSPTSTSRRSPSEALVLALGGVGVVVGLLAVLGLGLSVTTLLWLVAGWLAFRAVLEGFGAFVAATTATRVLLGLAALVDVFLLLVLVTHSSGGGTTDGALFGGGLVALWGMLHLALGLWSKRVVVHTPAGPRLLKAR